MLVQIDIWRDIGTRRYCIQILSEGHFLEVGAIIEVGYTFFEKLSRRDFACLEKREAEVGCSLGLKYVFLVQVSDCQFSCFFSTSVFGVGIPF